MLKVLQLAFEDDSRGPNGKTFFPGDTISGICTYTATGYGKVLNKLAPKLPQLTITFQLTGLSKVKSAESFSSRLQSIFSPNYAFKSKIVLVHQEKVKQLAEDALSAGEHQVEFSFSLPRLGLKSSFESPHSHTRYCIRVLPKSSSGHITYVRKTKCCFLPFKVLEAVPIDTLSLRASLKGHCKKAFRSEEDYLELEVDLSRGGYLYFGDTAHITARFKNSTNHTATPYVFLDQTITLISGPTGQKWTKKERYVHQVNPEPANVPLAQVFPNGSKVGLVWAGKGFNLPKVAPTTCSGNILVEYDLVIGLSIGGVVNSLGDACVKFPITIGSLSPVVNKASEAENNRFLMHQFVW